MQSSPSALEEYNQLCSNIDLLTQDEKDSYDSVMTQCHVFLLAMGDTSAAGAAHDMLHPDPAPARRFMSRLSMNGFTVSDSEQVAIGHGVYPGASMINHSCRPNAVPSFWLRSASPPMLRVTTCRAVRAGEEVTIGYCDVSGPRSLRRDSLKSYKFTCDCELCCDATRDDEMVGLKCTTAGCNGEVRATSDIQFISRNVAEDGQMATTKYQCKSCASSDFDEALDVLEKSMRKVKALEPIANNKHGMDKRCGEELLRTYDFIRSHFDAKSSYYVALIADLFVQYCANSLQYCPSEQERIDLCRRALVLVNESRPAMRFCSDYPGNLSWNVRKGMEAKLRLFVNPMDMEALGMLKSARQDLLVYYPPSDAIILSLDESLATYSFS